MYISNKLNGLIRNCFVVGAVFSVLSAFLVKSDVHYFFFSYLTSFSFFWTLTLGACFFVLIQYVTSAGWSVVVRRVPELFMANIWLMALLVIPVIVGIHDLYHWSHLSEVAKDHLLQIKQPFLNTPFFIVRLIIYFSVWGWIANKFFNGSVAQDDTGDPSITLSLQRRSTYSLIILALTFTFASIDLIMSLTPHWYSTIFGIYIFAGAITVLLCFTTLVYMYLVRNNLMKNVVNVEHFHDLGKLTYGFNIFWSYIAFCQFFLIWYANVPEETEFYLKHFFGTWNSVTVLLAVGHFGIPFVFFISRIFKRNLKYHAVMLIWIIFMHFVDLFWIIMPTISPKGFSLHLIDVTLFLGIAGIYFGVFFNRMNKVSLYPIKDPRLEESLKFQNF